MIKMIEDMLDADYFNDSNWHPDHISASMLKKLKTSPETFYFEKRTGKDFVPSVSMRLGTILHYLFLTPDTVESEMVVVDSSTRATKKWKEAIKDAEEENDKRFYCTKSEYEKALAIFNENSHLMELFNKCKNEVVAYGDMLIPSPNWDKADPYALSVGDTKQVDRKNFQVKGKIDSYYSHSEGLDLIDLKTCADLDKFAYDFHKFGYHMQLAFYGELLEQATGERVKNYSVIAVETKEPYRSKRFDIELKVIEQGQDDITEVCSTMFDDDCKLIPEAPKQLETEKIGMLKK